jgi:hypothetical protein
MVATLVIKNLGRYKNILGRNKKKLIIGSMAIVNQNN